MQAPVLLRRPIVIAACVFVLGILAGELAAPIALLFFGAGAVASLFLAARRSPFALLAIPLCFFTAGLSARALAARERPAALPLEPGQEIVIQGTVIGAPERGVSEDSFAVELEAWAPRRDAPLLSARGTIRVLTPKAEHDAGDRLRAWVRIFPLETAGLSSRDTPLAIASLSTPRAAMKLEAEARNTPRAIMERVRGRVHDAIARQLDGEREAIVRAFATGDRSAIPRALANDFQAAGLSHLLAVSGLNLAIIAGVFVIALAAILRRIPRIALGIGSARFAAIPAIPFALAYTFLVGATPSAVRAAIMVLALCTAQILGRLRDAISALGLALLLMCGLDPGAVADISLQLSFAAVLGLFYLAPRFDRFLPKNRLLALAYRVGTASLAAALATAPIVACHFGQVSVSGIAANIPAHPLSSLILVPLALAGGLLALVSETIAWPVLWVAGEAANLLALLARAAAKIPGGTLELSTPNLLELSLVIAALIAIAAQKKRLLLIALAVLVVEIAALDLEQRTREAVRVTVLAAGQGDAIVVELPKGRTLVVDTGPPAKGQRRPTSERVLIPFLKQRRIRSIDRLIISHPHGDHAGGLAELARRIRIEEAWWTGEEREAPPETLAALASMKTRVISSTCTEDQDGVTLEVLGPLEPAARAKKVNDGSLVFRLRYQGRAILFSGDAELAEERALVDRCAPCLRADVLKLGHHGSKTSTSERFLEAVQPKIAVASLGRGNRFGFPHREVMERLEDRDIELFRTDLDGAVTILIEKGALTVQREGAASGAGFSLPPSL
jgi:competence protein ComEC